MLSLNKYKQQYGNIAADRYHTNGKRATTKTTKTIKKLDTKIKIGTIYLLVCMIGCESNTGFIMCFFASGSTIYMYVCISFYFSCCFCSCYNN